MKKFLLAGFLLASIAAYGGVGQDGGAVDAIGTIIADLGVDVEEARLDMGIMTPGQLNVTSWDGHTRTSPAIINITGSTWNSTISDALVEYWVDPTTTIDHFNNTDSMLVDLYTENTLGTINDSNKSTYVGLGNYEGVLGLTTTVREINLSSGAATVYVQGHIATAADDLGDYSGAFNFYARYKDDTPWN